MDRLYELDLNKNYLKNISNEVMKISCFSISEIMKLVSESCRIVAVMLALYISSNLKLVAFEHILYVFKHIYMDLKRAGSFGSFMLAASANRYI